MTMISLYILKDTILELNRCKPTVLLTTGILFWSTFPLTWT